MFVAVYFDDKGKVTKTVSFPPARLAAARHGFTGADADRFEGLVRVIGEDGIDFLRRDVNPAGDADAIARLVPAKQKFLAVDAADLPAGSFDEGKGWAVKAGKVVKVD